MKSKFIVFVALLPLTACMAKPINIPEEDISYSRALLAHINLYRMENGLDPLRLDPGLIGLARSHCAEMFKRNRMNHRNFAERLEQANSSLCVENIGWNYSSPHNMFDGWRRSSGHNQNMLEEEIHRVGIAEIGKYVTFFACNGEGKKP